MYYMTSKERCDYARSLMMDRFKFLYKNAPFILAEIQAEHFDEYPVLYKDIKEITGIDGMKLGPFNRKCNPDNISIPYTLLLVEEYLFSEYQTPKTELELYIENMYEYPSSIVGLLIGEYSNDLNYGENKRDVAICVLLELVRSLLYNQDTNTLVKKRTSNNDLIYTSADSSIHPFEIRHKQSCLDEYLGLARYRNYFFDKENKFPLLSNYDLRKLTNLSLVSSNMFLKDVNTSEGKLSFSDIRSVYFSYHDEIPWDTLATCKNSHDIVERDKYSSCCGNEFYVNEESAFCVCGEILQVCPKCGYLVNVSDKINYSIRRRIEHRDYFDKDVLRKRELLAELIKIGGMEDAKILVKRKNETKKRGV